MGKSSRTVRRGLCAGPVFQSCPRTSGAVQWLGYSLGYNRDGTALILDCLFSYAVKGFPAIADCASDLACTNCRETTRCGAASSTGSASTATATSPCSPTLATGRCPDR